MTRRALLTLGVAAVAWIVVADNLPAIRAPNADWTRPLAITNAGITAHYPRAWHAAADGNTIVIRSPSTTVWLASYGAMYADQWPARPKRLTLNDEDRRFQTCGFDFVGWNLTFADHGRVLQAVVRVEPGASKSDATRILDRLEIS